MEQTFVMLKPSAIQRNLIGKIIDKIEMKGFQIIALKMIHVTVDQAKKHYDIHKNKPFYQDLINSITCSPVIVMVLKGKNAVALVRLLAGATNPLESLPGTIRGDYSGDTRLNIIHSADSVERAQYEIGIYFQKEEFTNYQKVLIKETFSEK